MSPGFSRPVSVRTHRTNSPICPPHSWFFDDVSRKEADKLLLAEENPRGTFLVRPSEHNPNGFSLSVKDWEDGRGYHVKHYKIKPLDNGGYYIATNQTFPSLQALVLAYSSKWFIALCRLQNDHF